MEGDNIPLEWVPSFPSQVEDPRSAAEGAECRGFKSHHPLQKENQSDEGWFFVSRSNRVKTAHFFWPLTLPPGRASKSSKSRCPPHPSHSLDAATPSQ